MPRVNFEYNLNKDAWSWVVIAKDKNIWGLDHKKETAHIPEKLLSKISKSNFLRSVKITEEFIKKNPQKRYRELIIKEEINALKKVWKTVEKKYFQVLSSTMNKPIFSKQFDCFFTTGFMCPYNEKKNWFTVSFWHSTPFSITTICHEIMHLQFLHYYKDYLKNKGLKNNQIDDLKEALTFLLNESVFNEIILSQDIGYPKHQELRKKLKSIWTESRNFQNLLDKAIPIITTNGKS